MISLNIWLVGILGKILSFVPLYSDDSKKYGFLSSAEFLLQRNSKWELAVAIPDKHVYTPEYFSILSVLGKVYC